MWTVIFMKGLILLQGITSRQCRQQNLLESHHVSSLNCYKYILRSLIVQGHIIDLTYRAQNTLLLRTVY